MVQIELENRNPGPNRRNGVSIFSSTIKCSGCGSRCGSRCGSKVWHSTSKYPRTIYQYNHTYDDHNHCRTGHPNKETIRTLFISAVNKLLSEREEILRNFELIETTAF